MQVAIVKYNAGNVYSVVNALKRLGIEPLLTDDAEQLRKADRVVFPGQGEASTAMEFLRQRRLDEVIRDLKQPVLGICIGQQLLCRHSEEGNTDCIGVFDVDVKRFQPQRHEDKVPHMGWNQIDNFPSNACPLFDGISEGDFVYFVHSFHAVPDDASIITSTTDYGEQLTASVAYKNIIATQFHPEKSGDVGLQILKNFLEY